MRVTVTGVAGFIGSWVAETLLERGHEVLGMDCFVDFYPRGLKEDNIKRLRAWSAFRFVETDLADAEADRIRAWLSEYPFVIHEAAQPGVQSSWGPRFAEYVRHNLSATQRLLEACKDAQIERFVYASSSSVYGRSTAFPLREDAPAVPVSPYGVTKLAAENLTRLYYVNYGVPTVALRYFTVYGPRQRPDMAFHRLIRALLLDETFMLYGDGNQSRHFTYVADVVEATIAALFATNNEEGPAFLGEAINIGGGAEADLWYVIRLVQELTGRRARINRAPAAKGDVHRTEADMSRAKLWLEYEPRTSLETGLRLQVEWLEQHLRAQSVHISLRS